MDWPPGRTSYSASDSETPRHARAATEPATTTRRSSPAAAYSPSTALAPTRGAPVPRRLHPHGQPPGAFEVRAGVLERLRRVTPDRDLASGERGEPRQGGLRGAWNQDGALAAGVRCDEEHRHGSLLGENERPGQPRLVAFEAPHDHVAELAHEARERVRVRPPAGVPRRLGSRRPRNGRSHGLRVSGTRRIRVSGARHIRVSRARCPRVSGARRPRVSGARRRRRFRVDRGGPPFSSLLEHPCDEPPEEETSRDDDRVDGEGHRAAPTRTGGGTKRSLSARARAVTSRRTSATERGPVAARLAGSRSAIAATASVVAMMERARS